MTDHLALDAARRLRKEFQSSLPSVRLDDRSYSLPRTLPAAAILALAVARAGEASKLGEAFAAVFGQHTQAVLSSGLDMSDLGEILGAIYGEDTETLGGSLGLGISILEHSEAVEADFQRYYGLDLATELWGPAPISWRRLRGLVTQLPLDSAFGRAHDNARKYGWTITDQLLANLLELVDLGNRNFIVAHSKKGAQAPKPIEIHRPWEALKKRGKSTISEIKEFFGGAVRARPPDTPPKS